MTRLAASAGRRLAALRHPARATRFARALWIAWAVVVWNVVFDHVIVSTGRRYVAAAESAVRGGTAVPQHFENMDAWMQPAVRRALWTATASASAILAIGLPAIHLAARATHTSSLTTPG